MNKWKTRRKDKFEALKTRPNSLKQDHYRWTCLRLVQGILILFCIRWNNIFDFIILNYIKSIYVCFQQDELSSIVAWKVLAHNGIWTSFLYSLYIYNIARLDEA